MKQKCAVITGASRGIGSAAAERLAADGWNLALSCVKSEERLSALADRLHTEYGVTALAFKGDMGIGSDVNEFFSLIEHRLGGVDLLVNNAGISRVGLLSDLSLEEWDLILRTNVTSAFLCTKAAIPYMLRQKSGRIINISSVWGVSGASCEAAYSASKGALNAFTQAMAKELSPSGIAVNAVACGAIDTDMNSCFTDEEKAGIADSIPAGRFGTPAEAADLICALASQSVYLTGQIIRLDGGWI